MSRLKDASYYIGEASRSEQVRSNAQRLGGARLGKISTLTHGTEASIKAATRILTDDAMISRTPPGH